MTPQARRYIVTIVVGCLAGLAAAAQLAPEEPSLQAFDFTYPWTASRALLSGNNPYAAGRATQMPFGEEFAYPLPAAILTAPLAWLPVRVAGCLFVAIGIRVLAFALTTNGLDRLALLASAPVFQAIRSLQWSPLLTGAALLPGGLWLSVAKPNLFIAFAVFRWKDRRAVVLGVLRAIGLCTLSIVLVPTWPWDWMRAIRSTDASPMEYRVPIASLLGAPIALVKLRWRASESWLTLAITLAMACIPQSGFFYDQRPLLVVASSRREALFASACSVVALGLAFYLRAIGDFAVPSAACMPYVIIGVYWSAVMIALARGRRSLDARPEANLSRPSNAIRQAADSCR